MAERVKIGEISDKPAIIRALFHQWDFGLTELFGAPLPCAGEVPDRPQVSPLVRAQLADGETQVCSLDQHLRRIDEPGPRAFLEMLDGRHTVPELEALWAKTEWAESTPFAAAMGLALKGLPGDEGLIMRALILAMLALGLAMPAWAGNPIVPVRTPIRKSASSSTSTGSTRPGRPTPTRPKRRKPSPPARPGTAPSPKSGRRSSSRPSWTPFSSDDLVHWTKHRRVLDVEHVSWAAYALWAPSAVEKDGKYYLFFGATMSMKTNSAALAWRSVTRPAVPSGMRLAGR
ncbi:MAG: family 43 glycosylhydrolase [Asticcacaulis sp.]